MNFYHYQPAVKRIRLIITVLLLLPFGSFAQSQANNTSAAADIANIRQVYQKINSLSLSQQRFTYESSGCVEDGVVTYYLNNKNIVKIIESGSIGDGSWSNEFYYDAGRVVFGLETIIGGPAIGKVTKTQYRYYIKNGRPVQVLEGSKVVKNDSKATDMITTAGKVYKAYITKDIAGALCN